MVTKSPDNFAIRLMMSLWFSDFFSMCIFSIQMSKSGAPFKASLPII